MELSFQHISFLLGLLLLIPLAWLFVYVLQWKQKVKRQIGDKDLIEALTKHYSPRYFFLKFFLIFIALALCIVAIANLRSPKAGNTGDRAGIDVMIALDVSNSMLAQDIKPNRLERAKQVLNNLIDKIGDNRMGIVLFAGQAFLQMPMTTDLAAAKLYVSNASPDAVPSQGTVVGDALRLCNVSLDTKEKKYKAVILITDGEDHDDETKSALQQLKENGVVVYTIGIGSPEGAPIFDTATNDYRKDENGNTVISKLNEKVLQTLAQETGGEYQLFRDVNATADRVMAHINRMEKKHLGGTGVRVYNSYFQWFLIAALICLLLEIIVPERTMKWLSWKK